MKQILLKTWLMVVCLLFGVGTMWAEDVQLYKESFTSTTSKAAAATAEKVTATQSMFYDKTATVWSHYTSCSNISKSQTAQHTENYCKDALTTSIQHTAAAATTEYTVLEVTGIDISGATNLKLNYAFCFSGGTNYKAYAKIDSGDYVEIKTATSGSQWQYVTSESITGTGDQLSLKFTYKSNKTGNIFYLDEILVTGTKEAGGSTPLKTLSSIAVKTAPQKVTYTEGEFFDPTGLIITKTFDDAPTEDVSYASSASAFTFNPSLTTALQTSDASVQISVGGKSTTQAITVNALPSHTARFSVNGIVNNGDDQVVKEGKAINFPADPTDVHGKKFQGWTKTADYSDAAIAPSDLCKTANMGDADVTFYAVFATQVGTGSDVLTKITAVDQVTAGTYALISFDEAVYVSNAAATGACPSQGAVTKTSGAIDIVNTMKWTVTGDNTVGYVFESVAEKGKYLWGGSANDGTRVNINSAKADATNKWFVVVDQTYGVVLYNKASDPSKRYLAAYSSSDWRNYTSISNTQKGANLYKVITVYMCADYCTTVVAPEDYQRTGLTEGTLGTICLPYAVEEGYVEDATFYEVAGKRVDEENNPTSIVFSEVTSLEAGKPYVFLVDEGKNSIYLIYANATYAAASSYKGFFGVYETTMFRDIVPAGYDEANDGDFYVISGNKFQAVNAATSGVNANRGYLRMKEVPLYSAGGSNKMLVVGKNGFEFEENTTTSIEAIEAKANETIFNLQGQRINRLQKGVNIVNGHKVVR